MVKKFKKIKVHIPKLCKTEFESKKQLQNHKWPTNHCTRVLQLVQQYTFINGKDIFDVYKGCTTFENIIKQLHNSGINLSRSVIKA